MLVESLPALRENAPVSPYSAEPPLSPQSPIRVLVLVLLLVFAAEGMIMLGLQFLPAPWNNPFFSGLLDASALTLVMTPTVWYLVVLPLRRLFEARGRLLRQTFEAQEQERARVARDLHDGIGQHLTALLVGLRNIETADSVEQASARARDLRELAALAHGEVRRLAWGLRPALLEELGLVPSLERLCDDFRRAHATSAVFRCNATTDARFDPAIETALYRIAQEALTNVARHANAGAVEVGLTHDDRTITLSIRDDGRGFDMGEPAARDRNRRGFGLGSIRERVRMLGGELAVSTSPGRGTKLEVRVPRRGDT